MKKIVLILVVLFAMGVSETYAQSQKGWSGRMAFRGAGGLQGKKFKSAEWAIINGYNINSRFSVSVPVEIAIGLFEENGVKDHDVNGTLGLMAGYNILNTAKDIVEVSISAGSTLDNKDWRYMYYDCGVHWSFSNRCKIKFDIGAGFRYYDSYTYAYKNRSALYISFGFKIN